MKSSYLRGLNMASYFASSKIIVFATFAIFVAMGNAITASAVFVTVSLYGTIKMTVTLFFPLAIERLSEAAVSIRRIEVRSHPPTLPHPQSIIPLRMDLFETFHSPLPPEFSPARRGREQAPPAPCGGGGDGGGPGPVSECDLHLGQGELGRLAPPLPGSDRLAGLSVRPQDTDAPTLTDISIAARPQQLLTVVGPVGAGKVGTRNDLGSQTRGSRSDSATSPFPQSSLLSAILGELPHGSGTLRVRGRLAYAAQQPWVFPGTIRSNILFGREMDATKYEAVITACALKRVSGHRERGPTRASRREPRC